MKYLTLITTIEIILSCNYICYALGNHNDGCEHIFKSGEQDMKFEPKDRRVDRSIQEEQAVFEVIDLRSDTVTRPSKEMRGAIASAVVGDDGYGEDPSVNQLESEVANLFGKQAAVFMPSGTMANQAAILAQTSPGDILLAVKDAHIVTRERESTEKLSRVQIVELGHDGLFTESDLELFLQDTDSHNQKPSLIVIENTHNFAGGIVFPFEYIEQISASARKHHIKLHLDGARLFNAAVATGISVAQWARHFDTVMFCLSKGLGAPVGSMVVGDKETIDHIRKFRTLLGGRMRQAGILAAAGLVALRTNVQKLSIDHSNAERLAHGLIALGYQVQPFPKTNIVNFTIQETYSLSFVENLRKHGVLVKLYNTNQIRAVTHLDINEAQINRVLEIIKTAKYL